MNETWLNALQRDPAPEWAERLRVRLQKAESPRVHFHWPLRRLAPLAIGIVVAVGLFQVPAVRASAASLLALFRVVNFVAVPVDPDRLAALDAQQLDLKRLIGEHVQVIEDGGPPVPVGSTDEAAALAGLDVRLPTWLPNDSQIIEVSVRGAHAANVTADTTRLEQVMDALGITDLRAPAGLDGQVVSIRIPPVVMVRYEHEGKTGRRTRLFQTRSPEVTMPAGIAPAALGEIGLRILGLPRDMARQFAQTIDWNTTLIVPLPPTARSFKEIEVAGHPGIAVQYLTPNESPTTMVLWSSDDRVFGLVSIQEWAQVLAMADSVR
jgi:hypothetical protein